MATSFHLAKPKAETSSIDVIIRFKGFRYKKSIGISVPVTFWNSGKCRECREYPTSKTINIKLRKIQAACEEVINSIILSDNLPSQELFFEKINDVLKNNTNVRSVNEVTFLEYYAKKVDSLKLKLNIITIKKYITTYNFLKEYEKLNKIVLTFEKIDIKFYEKFESFSIGKGISKNTFGSHIKCIKAIYRRAYEDGLHKLDKINNRDFITASETSDSVYLTEEELNLLYECDLSLENIRNKMGLADLPEHKLKLMQESLITCRCKFLIGCYTALRVSDFNRLEPINLQDDFIRIKTHKTGVLVVIPIHPIVKEILDSGFNYTLPVSPQKLNSAIKKLCRIAGITQQVEKTITKGGKKITEIYEKCDLVTNHTARRSGATNMWKKGIPTISIMKITGHTTESSFLKYIRINVEENARMLASHQFFKK